jgi:hypothetical protein
MHEFTEEILYWTRTAGKLYLEGKYTMNHCMPVCHNNTVEKKKFYKTWYKHSGNRSLHQYHLIFYTETKNMTVKNLLAEKASHPFDAALRNFM